MNGRGDSWRQEESKPAYGVRCVSSLPRQPHLARLTAGAHSPLYTTLSSSVPVHTNGKPHLSNGRAFSCHSTHIFPSRPRRPHLSSGARRPSSTSHNPASRAGHPHASDRRQARTCRLHRHSVRAAGARGPPRRRVGARVRAAETLSTTMSSRPR